MPRPTSKAQLLEQTHKGYDALVGQFAGLTDDEMTAPGIVGDWSIKDVLAHLTEWQRMLTVWYETGKRGETPATPSEKYTWREIPALNQEIYDTYRDHPLAAIQEAFRDSHTAILALIDTMTDEELFTPKVYAWTKSTTLGSYLVSATSSHYDWAYKEIRRGLKAKAKTRD